MAAPPMKELLGDLAAQHEELWSLLDPLEPAEWQLPTPCEGWNVTDVVVHLHQTDELGLASLRGDLSSDIEGFMRAGGEASVDDAAAAGVASAQGTGGREIGELWRGSAAELRAELAIVDPSARLQWVVGRLTAHTLAATRLSECWIHAGDVAGALGVAVAPTNRLRHVARLAWRTLPYAFERAARPLAGPVGFDLVGPEGDPWTFGLDDGPVTVVRGSGVEVCEIAARRRAPSDTGVVATGPDAAAVLELVRTYA